MNIITLIGRVGKDPETRTAGEHKVTSTTLAVSEKRGDKTETEWFNLTAFDKKGEIIQKYVKKGDLLAVSGKLKTNEYEKDGEKKKFTAVIVSDLQLVGGKKDEQPTKAQVEEEPIQSPDDLPF